MKTAVLSLAAAAFLALAVPQSQAAVATAGSTQVGAEKSSVVEEVRGRGFAFRGGGGRGFAFRGGGGRAFAYRGGGRHWRGGGWGGRRYAWRGRRGGWWWGPGIAIGTAPLWYGYGYSSGGCGWLRARAINTGSSYWWRRYRACRGW